VNLVALAVLLSKLAHLHLRQIAFDRLLEEFLTGFVLGKAGRRFSRTLKNCRSPSRRAKVLAQVIASAGSFSAGAR
jgi:hypothetical protein